jgi:predicted DNA-binding transcriptional regulator AlpA
MKGKAKRPEPYGRLMSPTRELRRSSQPRRGLSREEAAVYVGVSATKFDEMIVDGRMPKPKEIDARRVWDVHALDRAFDALPDVGEENPWD